jgi:molybdenum cofactor cytidylyltransferase
MQLDGIILAAGLSQRMGQHKMMMKHDEKTLIERTILSMLPFVDRVIVVTGYGAKDIESVLRFIPRTVWAHNSEYELGMFSSFKRGCQELNCERFFMMPADMPFVLPETFTSLLIEEGPIVIPSYHMKAGHPILLDYEIVKAIQKTKAPHLRAYLEPFTKRYVDVDDPGVLVDLDTMEEYKHYVEEGRSYEDN